MTRLTASCGRQQLPKRGAVPRTAGARDSCDKRRLSGVECCSQVLGKHHGEREAGLERHLDRTGGSRAEDEPVLAHTHLQAEMCEDTGRAYSIKPSGVSDTCEHRRARITWSGNQIAGPVLRIGAAADANTTHREERLADDDAVAVMTHRLADLDLFDRRGSAEHRFRRPDE